ncbi:MAG TPA: potassium-transporting ATPase subunit KdpC [Anaeromyxobacteraceae bacterium]|nr:potassium-transporting ATPase subunit KdpC [Anaeromyxobacteraceae bacterium]
MNVIAPAAPPPRTAEPTPPHEERLLDHVLPALRATVATLVLTGLLYPLAMTGLAQLLFHRRAEGSFVTAAGGAVVGSELIGQAFASPAYLQPRPSAAGDKGYDPLASGGSNLGPTSQRLRDQAAATVERLRRDNPDAPGPVPVELATASASGLDPHLSPQAALWQAPRIARARGVTVDRVRALAEEYVEGRDLGVLGEPRVNVLLFNLALDRRFGAAGAAAKAAAPGP